MVNLSSLQVPFSGPTSKYTSSKPCGQEARSIERPSTSVKHRLNVAKRMLHDLWCAVDCIVAPYPADKNSASHLEAVDMPERGRM